MLAITERGGPGTLTRTHMLIESQAGLISRYRACGALLHREYSPVVELVAVS